MLNHTAFNENHFFKLWLKGRGLLVFLLICFCWENGPFLLDSCGALPQG